MTASPSSINKELKRNQYGLRPLSSVESKPPLQLISSQGQLQIHSAPYRGSFSAVMSEALRSAGLGSQVLIAQFLKGGVAQGPSQSISLCGNLNWLRPDIHGCISQNHPSNSSKESLKNKEAIQEVWEICKEKLTFNSINKLVLDEIGIAIQLGFIPEDELINALENRNDSIDVILTGPSIPTKVFSMADQITQLRISK
ncbi:cob(I)yrinic acid a,c-diamide adenosyltransferase [Prochlorococcus marinus]|uniref:cob(I)yrinic acid a,c-diamide adenosyltransferase n=1 Tax=Prochlorococcus marinus TaxID=1219 RepID=UPI0022B38809|nr:cob(I)yrinic acid a,c-diamide adenosyltransferase [Prochlorococcus marinus]